MGSMTWFVIVADTSEDLNQSELLLISSLNFVFLQTIVTDIGKEFFLSLRKYLLSLCLVLYPAPERRRGRHRHRHIKTSLSYNSMTSTVRVPRRS